VKYLIRDRDGKYPALFDAILADAGITVVLSGVRMPRMNSVMERWIQSCRHELLDRTLIWNQAHLLHALACTNGTITIIVLTGASRTPDRCVRCPNRSPIPRHSRVCGFAGTIASAASSTNTIMLPDLRGRRFWYSQAKRHFKTVTHYGNPEGAKRTDVSCQRHTATGTSPTCLAVLE
jgi:transposase InsO family protein